VKEIQLADGREGEGLAVEPNHTTARKPVLLLYIYSILSDRDYEGRYRWSPLPAAR
jgi:hypothetical protein